MSEANAVMDVILKRRSVRAYEDRPIPEEVRAEILKATLRAPTAGNLMLYSILEVTDPALKARLAVTCDNQPFIARAQMVWVFLADYQRWMDVFSASGVEPEGMQQPAESDLLLACCDALIAAQTAVIAAEALGVGSCYIGDIMEQDETHRDLLGLPPYAIPVTMLVFGYPTEAQLRRAYTHRFAEEYILFRDRYHRLERGEIEAMLADRAAVLPKPKEGQAPPNLGLSMYNNKFTADYSAEMRRSVREMLKNWKG